MDPHSSWKDNCIVNKVNCQPYRNCRLPMPLVFLSQTDKNRMRIIIHELEKAHELDLQDSSEIHFIARGITQLHRQEMNDMVGISPTIVIWVRNHDVSSFHLAGQLPKCCVVSASPIGNSKPGTSDSQIPFLIGAVFINCANCESLVVVCNHHLIYNREKLYNKFPLSNQ